MESNGTGALATSATVTITPLTREEALQGPGHGKLVLDTYKDGYVQPQTVPAGGYRHERVGELLTALTVLNRLAYVSHCSNLPGLHATQRLLAFELVSHMTTGKV